MLCCFSTTQINETNEWIQRTATRGLEGLEAMSVEGWLIELGMFSLENKQQERCEHFLKDIGRTVMYGS